MGHPTARALGLLLILVVLGLCAPERPAADATTSPPRITDADHARAMPACGAATGDGLGLPTSKTTHAAVTVAPAGVPAVDRTPVGDTASPPVRASGRIPQDVPVPRAPPLT